jgi:hypothetical protein
MQLKATGVVVRRIDDLRVLHEPEDKYDRFTNLKARGMEPAIGGLTTRANRIISWKPVRQNRKVTGLRLTFIESLQIALAREVRRS